MEDIEKNLEERVTHLENVFANLYEIFGKYMVENYLLTRRPHTFEQAAVESNFEDE